MLISPDRLRTCGTANVSKLMCQLCRVGKSRDASRDAIATVAAAANTADQDERPVSQQVVKEVRRKAASPGNGEF